ncbi:MAG: plasmid mobilization relaxosome protein MobC [Thiomicrospira sp.]|nr:plasmid mobilization relaxosome protein MobC [Thiomicrospira sp.]
MKKILATKRLTIRVTEEEFLTISETARRSKKSVSALVRRSLGDQSRQLTQSPKTVIHQADPELVREVAKIGNNLNQIARHLNGGGHADTACRLTLAAIADHLAHLVDEVKSREVQQC